MKIIAAAAFCVIAALMGGCDAIEPPRDPWETAPQDYVCTVQEMARVEVETRSCNANTSYFSTYCYGSAFMRICKKRSANKGGAQ